MIWFERIYIQACAQEIIDCQTTWNSEDKHQVPWSDEDAHRFRDSHVPHVQLTRNATGTEVQS